jgi:hypothetical protein
MAQNFEKIDLTATKWFTVMKNRQDLSLIHTNELKKSLAAKFNREKE